jgi:hypothetical protein
MLKVKNIENIQDDDSISREKIHSLLPDKQFRTKKKLNNAQSS